MHTMRSMAANKKQIQKTFYMILFIAYLIFLFYLLFFSEKMGRTDVVEEYRYNLVLFREIKRFYSVIDTQPKLFWLNIPGNVLAFMPFGFLIPRLREKRTNVFLAGLFSLELSFLVELLQLIFKLGCFDVDDLLLNTVGGILGYLLYLVFRREKQ